MIVICAPQRLGPPAVPSTSEVCMRCTAPVWLSVRAGEGLERGEKITGLLCVVCAMAVVVPGDTIARAPWLADDLEELER